MTARQAAIQRGKTSYFRHSNQADRAVMATVGGPLQNATWRSFVEAVVAGERLVLQPIDYVGETPLAPERIIGASHPMRGSDMQSDERSEGRRPDGVQGQEPGQQHDPSTYDPPI